MAKPFKFRYVNQLAGTFVGAIALALIAGVILVGRAQKWFVEVRKVLVMLPPEGSLGLKVGGEVRMFGVTVGTVDAIDPPNDQGRMLLHAHVEKGYAAFIRLAAVGPSSKQPTSQPTGPNEPRGSQAIIHIPLALGDPFLEFTRGYGAPLPDEPTAPSFIAEQESGTGDAITQLVADVRTHTLPATQVILEQYAGLAMELRSQNGSLQHTLAHLDQVTANLGRTDSVVGRLTTDKVLADQLEASITKLSATVDDLHAVMADLQKTSSGLPAISEQSRGMITQASTAIGNVRDATAQLPGLLAQTQQSMMEANRLIKGMEALPLIRDHIDNNPQAATLRPTALGEEP
jgi:ABC-type transporter Mla subunit MlaD